jgi:pSer/pThr/pTyr-binding forkhead associated (FHA) protein
MDAKLVMFKANGNRKDFSIKAGLTVIGRGEDCDLRVPIMSVSRRHCELANEGEAVKVKDLGSSNGTYINNQRVNEAELSAGDRLVIGPIVFTVQINGQPEEIKPVKTRGQRLAEAGEPGMDEVVDLEADVTSSSGDEEEVDIDPIAALEALASEPDDEENKDA